MDITKIHGPEFIKQLSYPELSNLAEEIRAYIIEHVSVTGGHLSPNLGVVELTLALHKVFNSPHDKIIFDVGHQTYAHKIITGRANGFHTLRQLGGMSGFAKTSESIHDAFEAGHSSTSISAAAGFAVAKEKKNESIGEVIAVIGDAAVANGMAFEALNFLGQNPNYKVIIIINDNGMSISKNVGAISKAFNKMRIRKSYRLLRHMTPKFIDIRLHRFRESLKSFLFGGNIFESLGFKYFTGINGHNIKEMVAYFEYAKKSERSIVLHVKTIKGKGYSYAEFDATGKWHGVGPFDINTGEQKKKNADSIVSYSELVGNYVLEKAKKDGSIVAITPAMVVGSGLLKFEQELPQQLIDVGIAESNAVTLASSMALNGMKPFVSIYSTFLQRAYDQINHDVARINSHVVFGIDRSGIVEADGDTHQGLFDISLMRTLPNFAICMGKDGNETKNLLDFAFDQYLGPIAVRYPKANVVNSVFEKVDIELGIWEEIIPPINQVVITYGSNVLEVKELLSTGAYPNVGLINARFIKPIDYAMINRLLDHNIKVITFEETQVISSLGSSILEYVSSLQKMIQLQIIGVNDHFVEHGKVIELKEKYNINIESLKKALDK
jgi:1-deoxy-D-xylulose-5-phosphate synthase